MLMKRKHTTDTDHWIKAFMFGTPDVLIKESSSHTVIFSRRKIYFVCSGIPNTLHNATFPFTWIIAFKNIANPLVCISTQNVSIKGRS